MAPALASGAISLNTSAIYAGQAVGAATGGWLIGLGQMDILHWVGLAGLLMSWWVSRAATNAMGARSLKS
jgi:predicted MFS family arabinose efflux permease